MSPTTSCFDHLPGAVVDFVLCALLPVLLPRVGDDFALAHGLAIRLLEGYHPRTARELRLAGQAILFGLEGMAALGQSAAPDLDFDRQHTSAQFACGLTQLGQQARARLDALQRVPLRSCAVC